MLYIAHQRWRFAVLHVPTHSGSNTLFAHARDNRVSQGLHRTAGAGLAATRRGEM